MIRFKQYLLEGREDWVKKTFGRDMLLQDNARDIEEGIHDQTGERPTGDEVLDNIIWYLKEWDPGNGKNLVFLARMYTHAAFRIIEDLQQVMDDLDTFIAGRKKLKTMGFSTDLNSYKEWRDFLSAVDHIKGVEAPLSNKELEKELFDKKEAYAWYKDGSLKIIKLQSERAACHFGKGTRWCTAATKGTNYFSQYEDDLYVIYPKGKKRYQFYFGRIGNAPLFADERDIPLAPNELKQLIMDYPGLRKAFDHYGRRSELNWFRLKRTDQDIEEIFSSAFDVSDSVKQILGVNYKINTNELKFTLKFIERQTPTIAKKLWGMGHKKLIDKKYKKVIGQMESMYGKHPDDHF